MSYILLDIGGYFELSGFELLRFYSITTSKKVSIMHFCFLVKDICLILTIVVRTCPNYYFYSDEFRG